MKFIQYINKVSVFIPGKTDRKSRLSFNSSLHSTSHLAQFNALNMQPKKGPVQKFDNTWPIFLSSKQNSSRAAPPSPHSYHAKSFHLSGREDRSTPVTKMEGKDGKQSDLGLQAQKKQQIT
jgi:hypothetical protein